MGRRRFRVEPGSLVPGLVALPAGEGHHARVTRIGAGDEVELFDGAGASAVGRLVDPTSDPIAVAVTSVERDEVDAAPRFVVVQAVPVKPQRLDTTIRLLTELGCDAVHLVTSSRSQVPESGLSALRRRLARWERIAETSAKQCGRTTLPAIKAPIAMTDLGWDELPPLRIVLDPRGRDSLAAVAKAMPAQSCALLVGPEGGWSADEVEASTRAGARTATLGPRVLRADSAGPVALTVVQSIWGDLA
ncbi:MAG: RsmE family RNA methyltransferase [Acidobacteria bacterium]|nr:RsmE family RNA methyltransferase [Acidobacteriota bacterium]